jgi:hypothetical protein
MPRGVLHLPKGQTRGRWPKIRIVVADTAAAVAAATSNSWERQVLKREKLEDDDAGPLLWDVEAGQLPEWRDISDRGPTYKSTVAIHRSERRRA